jgi:hypothetical protein
MAPPKIVLVDCSDEIRLQRLIADRLRPELATAEMLAWAGHLRREALAGGHGVLDTSDLTLEESVKRVRLCFPERL